MEQAKAAGGIFQGWWIVAAGFVCTALLIGSTTYSFGLFVAPLSTEFGLSRANANIGFMALLLGFAVWAPLVGRLLDRRPARQVIVGGGMLFAAGFVLMGLSHSPTTMALLVLGPVSIGTLAAGALAANTIAARWFLRQRGRALGVLAVATSAGGFLMPPLVAFLMQGLGWRPALMVQGLFVGLVIAALGWLLMRDRPSDLGLTPDGQPLPQAGQGPAAGGEIWTLGKLLRTRNFWLLSCGAGILLGADQALLSSLIPYGTDAGLTLPQASLLVSTLTFSAILGKLAIGALADRHDKRLLFCAVAACNFAFLVILLLSPGYTTLLIACSIIGLAIGGTYPLWTTLAADCFGTASFGSVLGGMNLLMVPFSIVAVRYIGEVFDRSGSYDIALMTFMGTAVLSTVLILALRLPPRS
ncbi:MFS transporter [Solimonas fluminis]|uniref:MFS transporter n=1 Tax=Solimonas fluminis TaxID=2086571 RepID=A0A2S5TKP6_9GAMM|nr:MFS transporter [Solimonas fluminis]PPE75543.1 MFS transporter [Solimonas fluminis]